MTDIFPPTRIAWINDKDYWRFTTKLDRIKQEMQASGVEDVVLAGSLVRLGIEVTLQHPEWAMAWRQHIAGLLAETYEHENDGLCVGRPYVDAAVEALPITIEN